MIGKQLSRDRAHPAEVTAARLLLHVERWHERLTPQQRDAIATVRHALHDIADEDLGRAHP